MGNSEWGIANGEWGMGINNRGQRKRSPVSVRKSLFARL
jgi:hypothetical protein